MKQSYKSCDLQGASLKVLELFSGTGSVGKCCKQLGWDVVSVDMILPADHKCDIMDFDYKQYDKDEFDIIWASPPCTNYSKLQDAWLGRMRKGQIYTKEIQEEEMKQDDKLVLKTLEIIDYFKPHYWFIENPAASKMKDREFMKDLNFYLIDYCMYSNWGYRKRTRIWTNREDFKPLICDGKGTCGNMVGKLHKTNLGNADRFKRANILNVNKYNGTTQQDRYRIPEDLIFSLFLD
jgi:site-specific DNA-cytosine methylase